jgi:hypothetical protein
VRTPGRGERGGEDGGAEEEGGEMHLFDGGSRVFGGVGGRVCRRGGSSARKGSG